MQAKITTETQAVVDWALEAIEHYLSAERASLSVAKQKAGVCGLSFSSELKSLWDVCNGDTAQFAQKWVFKCMEKELSFAPDAGFNIWGKPEFHQLEQFSFVAILLRLGLRRVDWDLVGREMYKTSALGEK